MARGAASVRRQPPFRAGVASDHALIAEAVVAALRSHRFEPLLLRWPRLGQDAVERPRRRLRSVSRLAEPLPDVGLVLSDLAQVDQVSAARALVSGLPLPWLVMAGPPAGPGWGGLYDAGAALVVSSDTPLSTVCELLDDLAAGREPPDEDPGRGELVEGWRVFVEQRAALTERLESLTDREGQVLELLHQGIAVRHIAERAEVAEGTVRSHVKAILRKLDVNSQVAAVAAFEHAQSDSARPDQLSAVLALTEDLGGPAGADESEEPEEPEEEDPPAARAAGWYRRP